MRRNLVALAAVGMLTLGGTAACSDDGDSAASVPTRGGDGTGKVGVILPDTTTSQRWGTDDPKLLKAAFDAADVPVEIENAQGDGANFKKIGDRMIADGVTVLMIANLDPDSGAYVLEKARANGVKTIDYDRLTLNGGADYYVSFDNEEVGRLQAVGLVKCVTAKGKKIPRIVYLNGSTTDNNATLFKEGADTVLQEKFDSGEYMKGPEQAVADWKREEAVTVFREIFNTTAGQIDGVLAANDTIASAAIQILKERKVNGIVPVTGQDAEVQGLQNILVGDQCMTVYKPIKDEATAAANLAIGLFKGEKVAADGRAKDPVSGAFIPAVLLKPKSIMKKNVASVIADGFVTKKAVCTGRFVEPCTAAGIK
ncbi:substrate-binding domain-containing protein [Winogradskya consettensis]|uniref:Sugar ABC transporter substrate-binding protein n=1 Tax=Winogradskya consettensis TaxID=113560 RepID=A0A919SM85_9ACTN|nr:substrate-binding domain-containing protein [Actinoplanes consettensis]GIM73263.1 sugar ABC transporter substrate-binding protein [Actinoplanes consettensis]